jgi:peptidoglycan hydrolase CwlO-like protein
MENYDYLIKALENYREVTYGQFDQEYKNKVQETQDAAIAIKTLMAQRDALQKELEEANEEIDRLNDKFDEAFR